MFLLSLSEWRVLYCTLSCNIGFLTLGIGYGFPSPIAREVRNSNILNNYQYGIFTGVFFLSAAFSGLVSMPMMYWMGRKPVIIVAACICGAGWVLIGFSRIPALLISGRAITGLGSGISIAIVPIYIAELAHKKTRGRHLSVSGAAIGTGVLIIYCLGIWLNYAWLAYMASLFCFLQILLLSIVPYTPTYLIRRELDRRALVTLQKLRIKDYDSIQEINDIKLILKEEQIPFTSKLSFLCEPYLLKAGCVVILILQVNQSSGVSVFSSYASLLLDNGSLDPNLIGLVYPVSLLISNFINIALIDKVGRKVLILLSFIGVITALIMIASYFTIIDQICPQVNPVSNSTFLDLCHNPSLIAWPMLSIILYGASFSLGCGPIGYVVLGEIIPLKIKHIYSGLGIFFLFMTGFVVSTLYPIITVINVSIHRSYFIFTIAIINIIVCILVAFVMPETKGKSITELEKLFRGNTIFCWCKRTSNYVV